MINRLTRAAVLAAIATLATLAGSGCASVALPVPPELANSERYTVAGTRAIRTPDRLDFATYHATAIERGWVRGGGWGVGGVRQRDARQSIAFRFDDDAAGAGATTPDAAATGALAGARVACETTAERHTMDLGVVEVEPDAQVAFGCRVRDDAAAAPHSAGSAGGGHGPAHDHPRADSWRIDLDANGDGHLEGSLTIAHERFQVRGVGKDGRLVPAMTYGFHVLRDGRVVAAVQTARPAAVWLAPELDAGARRGVAMAAVALLLYEEPDTDG